MESVRTCLVCRKKGSRFELCRFVRGVDGEICFDEKGDLPHRGAWVCPSKVCLSKGFHKRLLFKGERVLPMDGDAMIKTMIRRIKSSSLSRLGLLKKLGQLESGRDAVKRMITLRQVSVILFAKDMSTRSQEEIRKLGEAYQDQWALSPFLMDEIGQCLGRKKTGVVGLLKSRITDEIVLQIKKLSKLEQ
jgi:predicted RNA-binding protein YlxR (DUF448 family)